MPLVQQHAVPSPGSYPLPTPRNRSLAHAHDFPLGRPAREPGQERAAADVELAARPSAVAARGEGTRLDFMKIWRVRAPLATVWDEIVHAERWPTWWRGVEAVTEVRRGNADGVGAVRRYTWRGALPFRVRFEISTTRVMPLLVIEGVISGQLEGTWRWRFAADSKATLARCDWRLRSGSGWLRRLAPAARLVFDWHHETVMRWGADGLMQRLRTAR